MSDSERLFTVDGIRAFVWRELLKHSKETLVGIKLRHSEDLFEWVCQETDLLDRIPITARITHIRDIVNGCWQWPKDKSVPWDIYQGKAKMKLEWVLMKGTYPVAI